MLYMYIYIYIENYFVEIVKERKERKKSMIQPNGTMNNN